MTLPPKKEWVEGEIVGSKPIGCMCNLPLKLFTGLRCYLVGFGPYAVLHKNCILLLVIFEIDFEVGTEVTTIL